MINTILAPGERKRDRNFFRKTPATDPRKILNLALKVVKVHVIYALFLFAVVRGHHSPFVRGDSRVYTDKAAPIMEERDVEIDPSSESPTRRNTVGPYRRITPGGEHPRRESPKIEETKVVDAFLGEDGEVYELRRAHQKKNNNKKGAGFSAVKNSRATWNWNNKGGPNTSNVNVVQPFDNRCLRCGQEGHQWRQCHLPFQKVLVFSTRPTAGAMQKGVVSKGKITDKVAFTVGENEDEKTTIEEANIVQNGEMIENEEK